MRHKQIKYNDEQLEKLIKLLQTIDVSTQEPLSEEMSESAASNETEVTMDLWEKLGEKKREAEEVKKAMEKTLAGIAAKCPDFPVKPGMHIKSKRTLLTKKIMFKVAAVTIPLFVLAGGMGFWLSKAKPENMTKEVAEISTIFINAHEQEEVKLPDGTVIKLSDGAALEYQSDFLEKRLVKLNGDAFFSVAKMESKDFQVLANELTIRVLGTEFYVNEYGSKTGVALKTGSVEITTANERVLLEPYQQMIMDLGDNKISVHELTPAEMAKIARGKLQFRSTPLKEAILQIGEFFDIEIILGVIENNEPIRLSFDIHDQLEDVLFSLQNVSGNAFSYDVQDSKVIIEAW